MTHRLIHLVLPTLLVASCIELAPPRLFDEASGGGAPLPACDHDTGAPCAALVELKAGGTFSCARFDDDTVRCWGANESGQLGLLDNPSSGIEGVTITDLPPFEAMSLGYSHGCGIYQSDVWCWGRNTAHQLGEAAPTGPEPRALGLENVTALDVDWDGGCAIWGAPPRVSCWGTELSGQNWQGLDANATYPAPTVIAGLEGEIPVAITVGSVHACALTAADEVWCWGNDQYGSLGAETGDSPQAVRTAPIPPPVSQLGSGSKHNCVVAGDPQVLWCWGYLPQQDNDVPTPFLYWRGTGFVEVDHMRDALCARYEGGWVRCAGDVDYAQAPPFGPDGGYIANMMLVPDVAEVERLAAGTFHSCAATRSGSIWCWGRNTEGQLGHGFTSKYEAPAPITLNP